MQSVGGYGTGNGSMKCDLIATGEVANGRIRHVCKRGCKNLKGEAKALWIPIGGRIGDAGECSAPPFPHELGHWLALLLEVVFIRKRDYLWLKAKLGFAPKCGCNEREAKLNTIGERIRDWFGNYIHDSSSHLK